MLRVFLPCLVLGLSWGLSGCDSAKPDVVIPVVMKKYAFDPPVIRVKKGQVVELDVSTADVQHGFTVPDLGIRESIQPHRPAKIVFKADRAGVFPMTCSIICGPGHDDMAGKIVVE
jgi:cytochrome c oxidase subunit II